MRFSPDTAGKKIRELREKKGITQKELATARKMTQSTIAKQESGATAIGEEGLCWYADYFGVSADYLLGRTDVPETASRGLADFSSGAESAIASGAESEPPAMAPSESLEEFVRRIAEQVYREQRRDGDL